MNSPRALLFQRFVAGTRTYRSNRIPGYYDIHTRRRNMVGRDVSMAWVLHTRFRRRASAAGTTQDKG